jgi:hypothetical protein
VLLEYEISSKMLGSTHLVSFSSTRSMLLGKPEAKVDFPVAMMREKEL